MKEEQTKLDCDRHVVLWNEANSLARYPVGDSVEISVDLRGGDADQLLPKARDSMFYLTTGDALAAVPKLLRKMVLGHVNKVAQGSDGITKLCDCSADDPCASAKGTLSYAFPRAIYTPDPEFSEEARKRKINWQHRDRVHGG
jgi:hypothetical protein